MNGRRIQHQRDGVRFATWRWEAVGSDGTVSIALAFRLREDGGVRVGPVTVARLVDARPEISLEESWRRFPDFTIKALAEGYAAAQEAARVFKEELACAS